MTRHEQRHSETGDEQDLRDVIGRNIEAARVEKGVTVEELANGVHISVRLVQKHKAGDNAPGHANLLRYAGYFGKPVAWFFERHQELAA